MSPPSYAHEIVAWAKQRLDDVDATISEVEKASGKLKEDARKQADAALARLRSSRAKLQESYDELQAEIEGAKRGVQKTQSDIEAEWVEAESALQSFLAAAGDQADAVRNVVVARAKAQRQSWEATLRALREEATAAVETARGELDAVIKRLSAEAEKLQGKVGAARNASGESWKALSDGLVEARDVHDRTIQKIKDAFSKLF
jgi:chromosome segregation ATPase